MSLRPRYSLLTLLVLTALVAGGVKWWHGPHHVVEQKGDKVEVEYDFIRLWSREKIRQGPYIMRVYQDDKLSAVEIRYFRDDLKLSTAYHMRADAQAPVTIEFYDPLPMTSVETEQFKKAIEREQERFLAQGNLFENIPNRRAP